MKIQWVSKKKICLLLAALLAIFMSAGCNHDTISTTRGDYLLDTFVTVTIYGSSDTEALDEAISLCARYDAMMNRHSEDSELYLLNHAGGVATKVSPELAEVISIALRYCALSDGKYDITIAPVADLWNFQSRQSVPPSAADIEKAIQRVGWRNVIVSGNTVTLENGAMIDLGSIAKGYIADKIGERLREMGIESAIINLGGNILTIGEKPGRKPFSIGIQKPFGSDGAIIGSVQVRDTSFVSSGIYERYFVYDDTLYHHILDARDGYPAGNELHSVSILSERSVDGDALSTLCFLLDREDGLALIESLEGIEAVFVEADGSVLTSSGVIQKYRYEDVKS